MVRQKCQVYHTSQNICPAKKENESRYLCSKYRVAGETALWGTRRQSMNGGGTTPGERCPGTLIVKHEFGMSGGDHPYIKVEHKCVDKNENEILKSGIANNIFKDKDPRYFRQGRHQDLCNDVQGGIMYCGECNQTVSTVDIVNMSLQRWKDTLNPGKRAQLNRPDMNIPLSKARLNIELTLCIRLLLFCRRFRLHSSGQVAEGLKSLMKKEDDDEERSEGFVRIYEFFTRYVRRIHPDTHWKRAMKMNPNTVWFQLITPEIDGMLHAVSHGYRRRILSMKDTKRR